MTQRRVIAGRFEIGVELGAGAVGTVYEATDVETGERVALKKVRGAGADFARFSREVQSLARLSHPGVVRYVAHGLDESGTPYLVMEWLEGEDLRTRLSRGPLTQEEGVALARGAAETLAVVHASRLMHRDIKPGNLFLVGGRVDQVKLIDFGLARGDADGLSLTRTGKVVGTPAYMAPEQVRGRRDIDHRADLFSLGCVLYKALCGTSPFSGPSLVAVMTRVLLREPKPLASVARVTPGLADLVHWLLAKDPDHRPQSAAEVLAALDALDQRSAAAETAPLTPASSARTRRAAVTSSERRVVSVLLLGSDRDAPAAISSRDTDLDASVDIEGQVLGLFLVEQKGHMDRLPDGTRVITPAHPGTAVDQARWGARCALALRAMEPNAPMALAMGYIETTTSAPLGDAIERAAALLEKVKAEAAAQRAAPWIALDEPMAALLDATFEVRREPAAHRLVAVRGAAPAVRTLLGKATPTVGREWELSTITGLFRECVSAPAASAVLCTAAAGMGKSRLTLEVVGALRAACPQAVIWMARGDPAYTGLPFHLAGRVIEHAMAFERTDTDEVRRQRLLDRAATQLPFEVAERAAVILGEVASAPFSDDVRPGLRKARSDAAVMEEEMRRAWEAFVAAECADHPVVLVLDDLQWADAPSVRLVEAALSRASASPFMVLLFGRPEVHALFPRLGKGTSFHELRLKPLSPKASARIVEAALGDLASPELCRSLAARSEGNTFFLEELIRSTALAKQRAETAGAPESVIATVQAQLLALDHEPRRLLRAASVFGDVFWARGVAALLGAVDPSALEPHVNALIAKEIVVRRAQSRLPRETELAFKNPLLRECAAALLTEEDRALGHRLAAAWLEEAGETDPAVLAEHVERGGDPGGAARLFARAAERALRAADLAAAAAQVERAVRGADDDATRHEALALRCEIDLARLDWPAAESDAAHLRARAPEGSGPWIQATGTRLLAGLASARPSLVADALAALLRVEPAAPAAPRHAAALALAVHDLALAGQVGSAAPALAKLAAVASRASGDAAVRAFQSLALAVVELWQRGDPWSALQHAERAAAGFSEAGDRRWASFATLHRATCLHRLGAFEAAARDLDALSAPLPGSALAVARSFRAAMLAVDAGALAEAERVAAERLASPGAAGPAAAARAAEGHFLRSEIARKKGDFALAEATLAPALAALRSPSLAWQTAAACLARSRLSLGRAAEALALAREAKLALDASGGEGMRGLLVRLTLAEALHAAGDDDEARAVLAEAHDRLFDVADRITGAPARASFLERIEENVRIVALGRVWLERRSLVG